MLLILKARHNVKQSFFTDHIMISNTLRNSSQQKRRVKRQLIIETIFLKLACKSKCKLWVDTYILVTRFTRTRTGPATFGAALSTVVRRSTRAPWWKASATTARPRAALFITLYSNVGDLSFVGPEPWIIELFDGVLHVIITDVLNYPSSIFGNVCITNFSCLPHVVLQVLPASTWG